MRFFRPFSLAEILKKAHVPDSAYRLVGKLDVVVLGLDDYQVALPDDLIWVDFEPLYNKAFKSPATVVIINDEPASFPNNKTLVITSDPKSFFDKLASVMYEEQFAPRSFWSRCFNPKDRIVGKNCRIDKTVKIGRHVRIGNNVVIEPYVVIHDNVIIGDNVFIRSHCIIGGHPFSHTKMPDGTYLTRLSWGNTIVMNDVDLASFTNIDRGITGSTIIGAGTKTCSLCQIGHDTWLGSNCYVCSGVTIAGYVRIGNNCTFWGKAGVSNSIRVADDTTADACGIVIKDVVESGQTLAGFPAEPKREYWKRVVLIRKMASEYGR